MESQSSLPATEVAVREPGRPEVDAPASANLPDRAWAVLLIALGLSVLLVAGLILAELWRIGGPALAHTGRKDFVARPAWDPRRDLFGAAPYNCGTLVTTVVALLLAVPVSLGLALCRPGMAPPALRSIVAFPISLLAGIP